MEFFFYIIYSVQADVYYKGISAQPYARLQQHNSNRSRYTANKGPWNLVYLEKFGSKTDALHYEKKAKRFNRDYLLWLMAQDKNLLNKQ